MKVPVPLTDGETVPNNSTSIEPQRPHEWCLDAVEAKLLPNKKQAVCPPNNPLSSGSSSANTAIYENDSKFSSTASQCNDPSHDLRFASRPLVKIATGMDSLIVGTMEIEHFWGNDSCGELSASHMSETPHSVHASEAQNTGLDVSKATSVAVNLQSSTTRSGSMCKGKLEKKIRKKEAPNRFSFPPNVRSMMSTGIFDGFPVKYMSSSGEELHGIIKDSGYLVGCQTCNFSKVLNAYEFERHTGCKTKHPNNHIYFDNGKTLYGIVQELRGTPENLFEKIQTVNGSAINQKSFCLWEESFQAASRELERICSEFASRKK